MKQIIYLTGMPRSGSTLMANILANNPKIGGGETSPLLEYIYAARANYSNTPEVKSALDEETMKESYLNFCRLGMSGYAERITEKEVYLDKSRGWMHYAPFLWEIDPNAKIIVCVRDIRMVVASLEKKWRQNPSILDNRDNPGAQQFITIDQRVNHFLSDPPLGIALKRLYNFIQTGNAFSDNVIFVDYDDLASNPTEVMKRVYKFLGMTYCDVDYKNVDQKTIENDRIGDFGIYGDHKIRPKVKPLEKDFSKVLGRDLADNIKAEFSWFYNFDFKNKKIK